MKMEQVSRGCFQPSQLRSSHTMFLKPLHKPFFFLYKMVVLTERSDGRVQSLHRNLPYIDPGVFL